MSTMALPSPPRRKRLPLPAFLSTLMVALLLLWTGVPLLMAVLWSLVDPDNPWSHPDFLPPSLSWAQWEHVFTYSSIDRAVITSFTIAPLATSTLKSLRKHAIQTGVRNRARCRKHINGLRQLLARGRMRRRRNHLLRRVLHRIDDHRRW